MKTIKLSLIAALFCTVSYANSLDIKGDKDFNIIKYNENLTVKFYKKSSKSKFINKKKLTKKDIKYSNVDDRMLLNSNKKEVSNSNYLVNSKHAYVYKNPNNNNRIGKLDRGTMIEVNHINKYGWAKLSKDGWVKGYLLKKSNILKKETKNSMKKNKLNKDKISLDKNKKFSNNYKINVKKIKIYREAHGKSVSAYADLTRGDEVIIDKKTKYGWYHIKDTGWVKGYLLYPIKNKEMKK